MSQNIEEFISDTFEKNTIEDVIQMDNLQEKNVIVVNENVENIEKSDRQIKIDRVLGMGETCTTEKELLALLNSDKPVINAYDGFEPSGKMHIAQALIRAINIKKLTDLGIHFKLWIADYFAKMNLKLGGDMKKIRNCGELMIETWKACGVDPNLVTFHWTSETIFQNPEKYMSLMVDISSKFTLSRLKRCSPALGREESDELKGSQILYPVFQVCDIYLLGIDICSLGVDQEKVNMLAREYAETLKMKFKPIIISHHMLMGLDGSTKMSKSIPDNAIFMDDSEAEINRKIKKAFCEPTNITKNPLLEYCKYIIFEHESAKHLFIDRSIDNGGPIDYVDYNLLEKDFESGILHPKDLKIAVSKAINNLIAPIRSHFSSTPHLKKLSDTVKSYSKSK